MMNGLAALPLPSPCACDAHTYIPFLDLSLKSVGDNFLPLLASRGAHVSLFWSCRVFVLPCLQPVRGPFLFLTAGLFISTGGDSKSEMILIKCFLYRNTHSTTVVFWTHLEVSFPTFCLRETADNRPYHKRQR